MYSGLPAEKYRIERREKVISVGKPNIHYLSKMIKVNINRGESF